MSGANVPVAPAPDKSATVSNGIQGSAKRKIAPRPVDDAGLKALVKIQPSTSKPDSGSSPPNAVRIASNRSQPGVPMMTGPYVLQSLGVNSSQAMNFFSPSTHPQLHQKLSAPDSSGNNILSQGSESSSSKTPQLIRPSAAPIPIAPRPLISLSTSASTSTASSTIAAALSKPPKICPRPIEKKPVPSSLSGSSGMNGIGPNGMATQGFIGVLQNGAVRFPQNPYLPNQQFRFAFNGQHQAINGMQVPQFGSIFPQVIHPGMLQQLGANGTLIPQMSGGAYLMSANHFPPHLLAQLSQQGSQVPKLVPITATPTSIPPSLATNTLASTMTDLSAGPSKSLVNHIGNSEAPKIEEPESDDDENEPPPLLVRDETIPPNVHEAFVQEAAGARMQFPPQGAESTEPLKHVIDGFVIEESAVPFELDSTVKEPLEILRQQEKETKQAKVKVEPEDEDALLDEDEIFARPRKRNRRSNNSTSTVQTGRSPSPVSTKGRRSSSSSQQKERLRRRPSSSLKSIKSTSVEERQSPTSGSSVPATSSRRSRELEGLLTMDFGPGKTPFKTTVVSEFQKEVARAQTALRPVVVHDYKERASPPMEARVSPVAGRFQDLNDDTCLNCKYTFASLGRRDQKTPQYCSNQCRKEWRKLQKAKLKESRSLEFPGTSAAMTAALIGGYTNTCGSPPIRKRLSDENADGPIQTSQLKISRSSLDMDPATPYATLVSPPPTASSSSSLPTNGNNNSVDHSKSVEQAGLTSKSVEDWTADDVERWINCVTGQSYGEAFKREEIDGGSLMMLSFDHLKTSLGLLLGPALKIQKAIDWLKSN